MSSDAQVLADIGDYKYGFRDPDTSVFKSEKGLNRKVVEQISSMKGEPQWMLDFRLKALEHFQNRPMPTWGGDLSTLNLDNIYYYVRPMDKEGRSWDDVPDAIKSTFDRLGIPEAERKFLSGVGAQYESEMVYHKVQESLAEHVQKFHAEHGVSNQVFIAQKNYQNAGYIWVGQIRCAFTGEMQAHILNLFFDVAMSDLRCIEKKSTTI